MTFTWINGQLVVAWILCCAFAVWVVGFINYRLRLRARRRIHNARGGAR